MDPMQTLRTDEELRRVLSEARTVAVLGAHPNPSRPAHWVPDYLHEQGYHVIGVNPGQAGKEMWGETVRARVTDVDVPVDLLDVFRRSEELPRHVEEILAMQPRPKVVWFQLGIRNDEVAEKLLAAGIQVVQDRCTYAEHRRLGIPAHSP